MPFPIFSLPAELRLQIYSYALAPTGSLTLTSTKSKRHSVTPAVTPQLLRANRQIHSEANQILYSENVVLIAADCHEVCWPLVSDSKLPHHARSRFEHLLLVCLCVNNFHADYEDVDFGFLENMTSLKTVQIAVIRRGGSGHGPTVDLLTELLARVPATASVTYLGCDDAMSGAQELFIRQLVWTAVGTSGGVCNLLPCETLHQAAMTLDSGIQGNKSAPL